MLGIDPYDSSARTVGRSGLVETILWATNNQLAERHDWIFRIFGRITEEGNKGGAEKSVAEFKRVAARAAQPVCLLQFPRDALLL